MAFFPGTSLDHIGPMDGLWDSGLHDAPYTFSHTFTQPGSFSYYCSHGHVLWVLFCGTECRCLSGPIVHETGTVIVDP